MIYPEMAASQIQAPMAPMIPRTIPAVANPVFPPQFVACERPTAERIKPTRPVTPKKPINKEQQDTTKPAMDRPFVLFSIFILLFVWQNLKSFCNFHFDRMDLLTRLVYPLGCRLQCILRAFHIAFTVAQTNGHAQKIRNSAFPHASPPLSQKLRKCVFSPLLYISS